MRGPHLQIHVTCRPRGHVTNEKRYISTFTKPMDPQSHVTLRHGGLLASKKRYISTLPYSV